LDAWVGAAEYPLPETRTERYYLHSDGDANVDTIQPDGSGYRGRLDPSPPGSEPPDEYEYDPADPVMTVGGYNTHWDGGVADRGTAYRNRSDVLIYQTQPLEDPLTIVGPITVTLYASTSAVDTDFVVVLSDVDPLDREDATWVAEGARRGRIGDVEADPRVLETYAEIEPLTPGEVYAWRIAVWPTARLFKPGHRLRIDVTSSNFPRYSRNLNTGAGLAGEELAVAHQTIYHDASRPSHVDLPVVPLDELKNRRIDGPITGTGNGNGNPEPNKE
jgi:putative CocE/NonD family hydrolase